MKIKVGNTHFENFPDRFSNNKNSRPIPMIELWFNELEQMRVQRDGFFMPSVDEILKLKFTMDKAIKSLDDKSIIKKVIEFEEGRREDK